MADSKLPNFDGNFQNFRIMQILKSCVFSVFNLYLNFKYHCKALACILKVPSKQMLRSAHFTDEKTEAQRGATTCSS